MKPLPFPYGLASELWLFGPPAKKQTAFHLLSMIGLFGSGFTVFEILENKTGLLLSIIAAILAGLTTGYGIYWCIAQCMPLLHWMVSKGIIQQPDEKKFRDKIIWTACWTEDESKDEEA